MRFLRLNHFQFLRLAACLVLFLIVGGCATRQSAPPPPIFPATSEAALRELSALPESPYDRLEVITVAAEIGQQLASAIKSAREAAAEKGANALAVVQDVEYQQKVRKRRLKIRRITYAAIHLR